MIVLFDLYQNEHKTSFVNHYSCRGVEQWQLVGLITRRSQVQILPPLPLWFTKKSPLVGFFYTRRPTSLVMSPLFTPCSSLDRAEQVGLWPIFYLR